MVFTFLNHIPEVTDTSAPMSRMGRRARQHSLLGGAKRVASALLVILAFTIVTLAVIGLRLVIWMPGVWR